MTESSTSFELERNGIEKLREHILSFKHKSSSSKAIKVALEALEKEMKRIDRDEKLSNKFKKMTSNELKTNEKTKEEDDLVKVEDNFQDPEEDMEWQDVSSFVTPATAANFDNDTNEINDIGKNLAGMSISSMSSAKIRVKSPLSALAVALHSSLRCQLLGFICTGVPSEESSSFAPAIRDISNNLFVPHKWDKNPNIISIRYRKPGMGMRILRCEASSDHQISIHFQSSNSEVGGVMSFPLENHINLASFKTAFSNNPDGIEPALHYKALPVLFNQFSSTFDLGDASSLTKPSTAIPNVYTPSCIPPPLASAFSPYAKKDFQTDLTPPGLFFNDPSNHSIVPPAGGNLMGPNHPIFFSPYGDTEFQPPFGDGLPGMRPKFDPYGPPMGPTGSGRGRGRGRNSNGGNPNPDHLAPPSSNIDPRNFYL